MTSNLKTISLKGYILIFIAGVVAALALLYKVNSMGHENKVTAHRHQLYKSCVENAGHYVFRKVEGVEGLAQLRLREWAGYGDWKSRSEYPYDFYGYDSYEIRNAEFFYVSPPFSNFIFFESPMLTDRFKFPPNNARNDHIPAVTVDPNPKYRRFSGYRQRESKMKEEHVAELMSHFGFTFQEVHTERDDLFDVIGSDLIVVDIATGEVLGLRKAYWSKAEINASSICPFGIDWNSSSKFVSKVLIADTPNGVDK
ncbi:MAG: hypothetical protein H7A01_11920 [Hahellaceae bacterium]|jgi:hypothetical protein|nr:hypothetical protein [Hahellaceae bacterium]MCP5209974.1 hypothetical protein [Hahellaceae bacterium]